MNLSQDPRQGNGAQGPGPLRLALWQGPSPRGQMALACDQITAALQAAGAMGAAALVVPEVFLPGYNSPDIPDKALKPEDPWLEHLSRAAASAQTALILGYAERDGETLYNSAIAFGPDGSTLAHYRKLQLYGPREQALYRAGDRYVCFELCGEAVALLICYDIEFAPHVAALAAKGVRAILVPTANMMPFTHVVRATVPAMAANHGVAIVYANYCGDDGDLTYVGGSLIAGPHGEILAQAGQGAALLVADLPQPNQDLLSTQAQDFRPVRP